MTRMRVLLGQASSSPDITADEVAASYPWPEAGRWVRAMMVTTLDGSAAGPDGLSGSISSSADKLVFNAVRRYADAVLVGAATLRAEEYSPMRAKPADVEQREADGQLAAPVICVVSGSLDLPWHLPLWRESTHRPLVLTAVGADPTRLATAREHAEVVELDELAPEAVLEALTARDLHRIVCEGGPSFLRDLVAADLVDEADITVSATFSGTDTSPRTPALPEVRRFRLAHVLEQDDFLMLRYLAEGRR